MVPPAAPDSDSDDDAVPTTFTSTFMIPQASGAAIPSFTMQQPASQVRPPVEPALPQSVPGGLHTLSPQAIDDMINSAVTRALHRATSAQNLTTPQTEPLPRQLSAIPPAQTFPATAGFATVAGLQGQQYTGQMIMQPPGMG